MEKLFRVRIVNNLHNERFRKCEGLLASRMIPIPNPILEKVINKKSTFFHPDRYYLTGQDRLSNHLLSLTFEQMLDLGLRTKTQGSKVHPPPPLLFFIFCDEGLLAFFIKGDSAEHLPLDVFGVRWLAVAGSSVQIIVKIMTRNSWLQYPGGHLLMLLCQYISWCFWLHAQTLVAMDANEFFNVYTWHA